MTIKLLYLYMFVLFILFRFKLLSFNNLLKKIEDIFFILKK